MMRGTPKRPDPIAAGADIPIRVNVTPDDPLAEVEKMERSRAVETHRSVYLKREDFEKYGYSPGCEGCRLLRAGVLGYKHHTPECRKRIEACLNEERHPRFERALERKFVAEETLGRATGSGLSLTERKRGRGE